MRVQFHHMIALAGLALTQADAISVGPSSMEAQVDVQADNNTALSQTDNQED